ncbi:hypothetical protein DPMN_103563 [Dreissena polymorpha]|uniref:Uncharacterized protein n=1 Tax=Dreissena polymorpha TaxID=45954 RepID=A0A9D4H8P6_DREPO|nr:hypothetical protein DPMN_103563 [Dreissena polymorpha]
MLASKLQNQQQQWLLKSRLSKHSTGCPSPVNHNAGELPQQQTRFLSQQPQNPYTSYGLSAISCVHQSSTTSATPIKTAMLRLSTDRAYPEHKLLGFL